MKETFNLFDVTAQIPNYPEFNYTSGDRIRISNNILGNKFYIHNESVTGIFENKKRIK